jgi:hypothetical protein
VLSFEGAGVTGTIGYFVVRITESGPEILSFPILGGLQVLPTGFASICDCTPIVSGLTCYIAVPFGVDGGRGNSDLLCKMNGIAQGVAPALHISLNQSHTASLAWTWAAPTAYLLVPSIGDPVLMLGDARSVSVPIDEPNCYVLYLFSGDKVIGRTNMLCAVPGVYRPADATPMSTATATALFARVRQASGR